MACRGPAPALDRIAINREMPDVQPARRPGWWPAARRPLRLPRRGSAGASPAARARSRQATSATTSPRMAECEVPQYWVQRIWKVPACSAWNQATETLARDDIVLDAECRDEEAMDDVARHHHQLDRPADRHDQHRQRALAAGIGE
jgi:hypothetical protein